MVNNPLSDVPTSEPDEIVAGDTLTWKREDLGAAFPSDDYALSYVARRLGDGTDRIAISASGAANVFTVTVSAATTAAWKPGTYRWDAYATDSGNGMRVRVGTGQWVIKANRATSTDDPRTHARKMLEAIEATLEGRATKAHQSYSISGRSLSLLSFEELIKARSTYRAEVRREEAADRIAAGKGAGNKIRVRFTG